MIWRIESEAIIKHQLDIIDKLLIVGVLLTAHLSINGGYVHRILNNIKICRNAKSNRIHRSQERQSISMTL